MKPNNGGIKFNLNWFYALILVILGILYITNQDGGVKKNITYTEFQNYVEKGYVNKIVAYNDNSPTGQYLGSLLRAKNVDIIYEQNIDSATAKRFSSILKQQEPYLQSNVVMFNTSGARTGLILSQMLISDIKPKKMFSTQVNYDSALLNSVHSTHNQELYVVNVIANINPRLLEYASLLGRDLKYNWVSYATAIGVELLLGAQLSEQERFFSEKFLDNQVNYVNKIYKFSGKSFDEYR